MLTFQNSDARVIVERNLGAEAGKEVANLEFLPFGDLESEVKRDVEFLKASKVIADSTTISGWVYKVESGKAKQVV